jgi:cytochrome c peroxidase
MNFGFKINSKFQWGKPSLDTNSAKFGPARIRLASLLMILLVAIVAQFLDVEGSEFESKAPRLKRTQILEKISRYQLPNDLRKAPTPSEAALARFGRKLFMDKRFSANGTVSCAKCHDPDRSFTDGKETAFGLASTTRNTPPLINLTLNHWFFWDGSADSLESQALKPVENSAEHGISRNDVFRLIESNYHDDYSKIFGPFPVVNRQEKSKSAMPELKKIEISQDTATTIFSSIRDQAFLARLAADSETRKISPIEALIEELTRTPHVDKDSNANWKNFTEQDKFAVNQVFWNFGRAIATYEKFLIQQPTPFDSYVQISSSTGDLDAGFSSSFGREEFLGMMLFLAPGSCDSCHSGPNFSDQQFHNIGLSKSSTLALDLGRFVGIQKIRSDPFNCRGKFSDDQSSESCRELEFLKGETPEIYGAFKTPTLRNINETGPYFHDGRAATLSAALDHYNNLSSYPATGHTEEVLFPRNFNQVERRALLAFLRSLSAPIEDLTSGIVHKFQIKHD